MKPFARCCLAIAFVCCAASAHAEGDPFLRRTTTVRVVERTGPAVVSVTTEKRAPEANPFRPFAGDPFFDRFFQDFFEPRLPQAEQSLGSGVLIDAQRHVLTNEHVVTRAERIRVSLADGREFGAKLIGADPNNDIAVLEVETQEKLPWIEPGSSADLMVGEPVIAIGNPFGLSHTVTTGVISALGRSLRTDERVYHGFLQTDASINPGNSGGPLLNAEGHLIAINTAVYNRAQGIGFAIPIDDARRVVRELIDHGEVSPVWLGMDLQDLDSGLAAALELPAGARRACARTAPQSARVCGAATSSPRWTESRSSRRAASSSASNAPRPASSSRSPRCAIARPGSSPCSRSRFPRATSTRWCPRCSGSRWSPPRRGASR
jgi:serine protease Do